MSSYTRNYLLAVMASILMATGPAAVYAYGSSSKPAQKCEAPTFTGESPAKASTVDAFSDFAFVASKSTDSATLVVKINGEPVDVAKQAKGTDKIAVSGSIDPPITETGFVLVSIKADDKKGQCPGSLVYRVNVSADGGAETEQTAE